LHELARLAERLGRWFEARGWLTLALGQDPGDRLAREAWERLARDTRAADAPAAPGSSLLDLLREPGGRTTTAVTATRPPEDPTRAAIAFSDDAEPAGLRFTYENGASPQHQIPETIGGGVAVLDYDGDGWLDVYL